MRFLARYQLIITVVFLLTVSFLIIPDKLWAQIKIGPDGTAIQVTTPTAPTIGTAAAPAAGAVGTAAGAATKINAAAAGTKSVLTKIAGAGLNVTGVIIGILVALSLLQSILGLLLQLASAFLNELFRLNVVMNPGTTDTAIQGWTIMRDVANSFFILIILWIAFAIIFNLENLGGKKMLARVIIIALLINFSLALVSAVFGFANVLARPFRNAIGDEDVAGLIVAKSKLQTVFNKTDEREIEKLKPPPESGPPINNNNGPGSGRPELPLGDNPNVFAAISNSIFPKVEAALPALILGAFVSKEIIWALAQALASGAVAYGVINFSWQQILSLVISNIFLLITILALVTASVVLIARIVAMTFLAALAPAAFILYLVPIPGAKKYWSMWWGNLFKWAFYAPAFYFLFYLSLLFLDNWSKNVPEVNQFSANFPAIFTLVLFLAFLFSSILIARYMGITIANSVIDLGKKAAWGAVGLGWGAALAGAGRVATRLMPPQGRIQRGLTNLAGTRGMRWIGGALPQRVAARFIGTQRGLVDKESKKIAALDKVQALADYGATFAPERKVALMQKIIQEGWLKDFEAKYGQPATQNALKLSSRYGMQKPLLEIRPNLITDDNASFYVPGTKTKEEALDKLMKTMDRTRITQESADDDVLQALLLNIKGSREFERIGRENNILFQKIEDYYEREKDGRLKNTFDRWNNEDAKQGIIEEGRRRADMQTRIIEIIPHIAAKILYRGRPGQTGAGQTGGPTAGGAQTGAENTGEDNSLDGLINNLDLSEEIEAEQKQNEGEGTPPAQST